MLDLSDEAIAAYVAHLLDLEDELETAQTDKREFFTGTREAHGKDFVASLKLAVKTAKMDADKRTKAEQIDADAERILAIMRKGLHVARGARARENIEEFDAETGEITEPAAPAAQAGELSPNKAGSSADPVQPSESPALKTEAPASAPDEPEHGTASSGDYQREPASVPLVSDTLRDADAQRPTARPNSHSLHTEADQVGAAAAGLPNSPEGAMSFSSVETKSGIGSARDTSAMLHPGVVDGPTTIALQAGTVVTGGESAATNSETAGPTVDQGGKAPAAVESLPANSNVTVLQHKPFREWCLNREVCAGQGRQHCHRCTKAHESGAVQIPHQGIVA